MFGSIRDRGSLTARAVAAGRGVGVGDVRDPLAATALGGRLGRAVDAAGRAPSLLRGVVSGALATHATLRMQAVDHACGWAVQRGRDTTDRVEQVVVVGAGYDTRAWRLEAMRGLPVHELDLPATQAGKSRRLGATAPIAANVTLHAVDLGRAGLTAALATDDVRDAGFDPARPTLWVWEAVAMYLRDQAVERTLADLGDASSPGSVLVMTQLFEPAFTVPGGDTRAVDRAGRRGFGLLGEPLRSTWTPDHAEAALARAPASSCTAARRPRTGAASSGPAEARSAFNEQLLVAVRR